MCHVKRYKPVTVRLVICSLSPSMRSLSGIRQLYKPESLFTKSLISKRNNCPRVWPITLESFLSSSWNQYLEVLEKVVLLFSVSFLKVHVTLYPGKYRSGTHSRTTELLVRTIWFDLMKGDSDATTEEAVG